MLDTLSREQRTLLRAQLDEADLLEEGQQQATQEAVEGDFGQTYTPQREYVDQAADLVNQIEQTTGQPTGIDPYAGQDNSFLKREPQSQRYMVTKLADGREYRTPITQTPKSVDNQIIEEGEDEQGNYYNIRKGDPADIDIELEPLDISARNKFSTGRAPAGDALSFLSDPYGSVMKTIAPNQSVPPKPMSPLTSSVVETVAPTPKQIVTPLEQRGAPTKKVPPPQIPQMVGQQKTGSVSAKTVRPSISKGQSTEAIPLEQRNIEDIDKQLTALESEQRGMPARFDLGVEAKKSQLGIEEEIAGGEAQRQADLALSEQQRAETIEKNAMQRIEAGEKILKDRLPVDPNRWFNSRSTLQKIAFGLALGFDQTGKNTAFLMNMINQDINAQEKEYEEKGKSAQNLFSVAKEMYGSSDKAREATRKAFGNYSKALSEAQKAGLNINSPQVQWQVAQDLTKTWTDNMKLNKDFIGLQLDAQKATQDRRNNDQRLLIDRDRLAMEWARLKLDQAKELKPDVKDREQLPSILNAARQANNMERLEAKIDPTSAAFRLFMRAKQTGIPVGAAVPREYSEYYNAANDFLAQKVKMMSGLGVTDQEFQRQHAIELANMADSANAVDYLRSQRAMLLNERMSGLTDQGRGFIIDNYPNVTKYLIQQR